MSAKEKIFIKLFYGLEADYAKTAAIWVLLAHGADKNLVPGSARHIGNHSGGFVSYATILRAIDSLVKEGILERKPHPRYSAKYKINMQVLQNLLDQPIPDLPFLPGLGKNPIPPLSVSY